MHMPFSVTRVICNTFVIVEITGPYTRDVRVIARFAHGENCFARPSKMAAELLHLDWVYLLDG